MNDIIVLSACIFGMVVVFAAVMRPSAPAPETPDEAPEALGESMAGLLGVIVFAIIGIAYVILT